VKIEKKKREKSPKMKYRTEISTNPRILRRRGWYQRKPKALTPWGLPQQLKRERLSSGG
jgi:hypothetical protein